MKDIQMRIIETLRDFGPMSSADLIASVPEMSGEGAVFQKSGSERVIIALGISPEGGKALGALVERGAVILPTDMPDSVEWVGEEWPIQNGLIELGEVTG
jgi:hypothetical protein